MDDADAPPASSARGARLDAVAVAAWIGLVGSATLIGFSIKWLGGIVILGVPPLFATPNVRIEPSAGIAVILAALAIWQGPRLARDLSFRWLTLGSWLAAAVWAAGLAAVAGLHDIARPAAGRGEYLDDVHRVGDPLAFLGSFVDLLPTYSTHVRSHPPGMVMLLAGIESVGLSGAWPAALLMIAVGAAAAPAVLIAVRELSGEAAARAVAPFACIGPAAIWIATSADALFAGLAAWGAALIVLASSRRDRRGDLLAVGGGSLLAVGMLLMSYGLVLAWVVPGVVCLARGHTRPLVLAVAPVGLGLGLLGAAGFWWPEGLLATREEYLDHHASRRPYPYFLWANLAALAVALGPAVAAGLARLRDRGVWLLAGGALLAVMAANVSGLSKGEVERIWLPFTVWIVAATAALPIPHMRRWLALQVALALAVQSLLRTPW